MFDEQRPDVQQFVFFFFQAEDGIRDLTVTGVQTCALPISSLTHALASQRATGPLAPLLHRQTDVTVVVQYFLAGSDSLPLLFFPTLRTTFQIGRASCRERV